MTKQTLLLADHHPVIREGLKAIIRNADEFKVVGEATNGWEAVERCESLRPDMVVLGIAMPELNGIDAAREICEHQKSVRVIIFSTRRSPQLVREALEAGVRGYIVQSTESAEILRALRAVANNEVYLSSAIAATVLDGFLGLNGAARSVSLSVRGSLSCRELEVFQLLAEGASTFTIAAKLHISPKTVATHRSRLMRKLGFQNVVELVHRAYHEGLIALD